MFLFVDLFLFVFMFVCYCFCCGGKEREEIVSSLFNIHQYILMFLYQGMYQMKK